MQMAYFTCRFAKTDVAHLLSKKKFKAPKG